MRVRARFALVAVVLVAAVALAGEKPAVDPVEQDVTQGALRVVGDDGAVIECPLKHTDVQADISGFIARVKVVQTFYNPMDEKIEAVYVFPLPHKSAVDAMTMVIGDRRIVGLIKRRAAAREIYEMALQAGQTAALLEQERPNIFVQSVGNIEPRQEVKVEITYIDVLEYDMGVYEFHFPMVVGPRYNAGGAIAKPGGAAPTRIPGNDRADPRVKESGGVNPPVIKPGFRTGHDVSLAVRLNAGVPIRDLNVANHKAEVERTGEAGAAAALSPNDTIPNKDFVLRYAVVGEKPEMAVLSHTHGPGSGTFMLMIQPKEDEKLKRRPPREISFLIDVSGSMSGHPTAKVREAMAGLLKQCRPIDTVQVITFAGSAYKFFDKAVPCTEGNIQKALNFTERLRGGGGTEMLKGIKMAINDPLDPERVRIVVLLTDGYIGNEAQIIEEVGRRCGDRIRFWAIGIGSSPNRFLTDGVAKQGGGMAKVLGLKDDAAPLVKEIMERITRAQLAKIRIDWGDVTVTETYPAKIPELWAGRPVIVLGLYSGGGRDTKVTVSGEVEGEPASWPLTVHFPATEKANAVLPKVWARHKIEDLMHQTYYLGSPEVEEAVTSIALEYGLMSQYTSFVAVDTSKAPLPELARPPRRMLVPVPLPAGTRYEGFFGPAGDRWDGRLANGYAAVGKDSLAAGRYKRGGKAYAYRGRASGPVGTAEDAPAGGFAYGGSRGLALAGPAPLPAPPMRRTEAAKSAPKPMTAMPRQAGLPASLEREMIAPGDADFARPSTVYWAVSAEFQQRRADLVKRVQEALKQAETLKEKEAPAAARGWATFAYLLDTACMRHRISNGEVGGKALVLIQTLDKEQRKAWGKQIPTLDARLKLVIRDTSLAEAVAAVAKAARLRVTLLPGSIEDACAVTGTPSLRVTYLDLRNATVAQALDWLLVPERMTWWVTKGQVVAGTLRRAGIESPWVYDVSHLAIPLADELKELKDQNKQMAAMKQAAADFIAAARKALSLGEDRVTWFAAGQLLVFADGQTHGKAGKLFEQLADPEAKVGGDLAAFHKLAAIRAAAVEKGSDARLAARAQAEAMLALDAFAWQLLAEAAAGRLDLEALTRLQVAWKSPALDKGIKAHPVVALRAGWAIGEAAKVLPKERELAALADSARARTAEAATAALGAFEKSPTNPTEAYLAVTYAALGRRSDAEFFAKARKLVTGAAFKPMHLLALREAATALLAPSGQADAKALGALIRQQSQHIRGDDAVVLTALACRRAGGDAWRAFRAEARDLVGRQPLSGSVVVLISRLSSASLPILASAR